MGTAANHRVTEYTCKPTEKHWSSSSALIWVQEVGSELQQDEATAKPQQQLKWPDPSRKTWGSSTRLLSWGAQVAPAELFVPSALARPPCHCSFPAFSVGSKNRKESFPWTLNTSQSTDKPQAHRINYSEFCTSPRRGIFITKFSAELLEAWTTTAHPLLSG